ncbi:hypothetical protein OIE66_39635 [Nonomuraea sp. NBC_01738]|uniref:hypothetical protein n=1 Tax=Nonomuraea sp. NBC_01738 TaxID=2976003 RepID=UPI002E108A6E|nr:hypothetical protein OIE66_39635 [Nonomuraea sp. NBC_01738]
MNALCRAAIVGSAIGLMEVFIHLYGPEDDFTGSNVMLLAPFPAGLLLGWLIRLPRWWLVAALAPFVNIAIIVLALQGLTFPDVMDLGVLRGSLLFATIGAGGHVAATAMLVQADRILRFSVIGALIIGFVGMRWNSDAISAAARERRLAQSGLPLIDLGSQQYRSIYLTEWFGELEEGPPSIELGYARLRDQAEIELYVMPRTVASPQAACTEPVPDVTHRPDITGDCRQVSTDVWVRTESSSTRVFAKHGNALVQVASESVSEADLLSILPTLRPTTAKELAAIGEI